LPSSSKARKQAAENYNHDIEAFRSWKQRFEEKRCDPNHNKPGTVWDAECEDILKNIVIANTALQQDQALLAKATQSYLEHLQNHFGQLNKQVGNLQRWCSDAKFGKGPDADASDSDEAKSDSKRSTKAEKPKRDNEKTANQSSDAEQASDSDDQGDNDSIEDTGDETDVTQGPTEGELEAAFPDPDTDATTTNDGADSNNGDSEDISKACTNNPNCQLLTGSASQEPTDTDDQATETTDNGVTAPSDGDNIGTTDDTTEESSAAPDDTQELTDDNSGASDATDDTAATDANNTGDSGGASEPETTDNSGTDEPDEVSFDPTAGLLE
jgi:hypothetical protein